MANKTVSNLDIVQSLEGKTREELLARASDLDSIASGIRDYAAGKASCPHCEIGLIPGTSNGKPVHLTLEMTTVPCTKK